MGWAKFDDQTHRRRKVRRLSDAAWRLWASAVMDCCAEASDGVIDGETLRELLPHHHEDHVRALLAAGMLHDRPGCTSPDCLGSQGLPIPDTDCYVVHDFHQWQLSRAEWAARKEREAEKGRYGAHMRHHANKDKKADGCPWCEEDSA